MPDGMGDDDNAARRRLDPTGAARSYRRRITGCRKEVVGASAADCGERRHRPQPDHGCLPEATRLLHDRPDLQGGPMTGRSTAR